MSRFTFPGIQGPSGQSFILRGNYPDLAAFNAGAGATAGEPGDAWLIESDGSLMVYSTEDGWIDAGDIIGPQGIQGTTGLQGLTGTNGTQGTIGLQGLIGIQGTQGLTGSTGVSNVTSFTVEGGVVSGTQPTFNGAPLFTGSYIRIGDLVHFQIQVDFDNITSFGDGQYYVNLPFIARYEYQVREGNVDDFSTSRRYSVGGHVSAESNQLRLNFIDSQGRDAAFTYNTPFVLAIQDSFHISGTYIAEPL
jgi:hypothetical protein